MPCSFKKYSGFQKQQIKPYMALLWLKKQKKSQTEFFLIILGHIWFLWFLFSHTRLFDVFLFVSWMVRLRFLGFHARVMYEKLDFIQRSYMISLLSHYNRTNKSSMFSMKSYMTLVWNQRNFNPGIWFFHGILELLMLTILRRFERFSLFLLTFSKIEERCSAVWSYYLAKNCANFFKI